MARFANWKYCPKCRSYRFTWQPKTQHGHCQDCDYCSTNEKG